jgi:hypothetical protein
MGWSGGSRLSVRLVADGFPLASGLAAAQVMMALAPSMVYCMPDCFLNLERPIMPLTGTRGC